MLNKIKEHIFRLIKDRGLAEEHYNAVKRVVLLYDNQEEAGEILADCFEKYVKYEFNKKNFNFFINSIDPKFIPKREIQHAFYRWEDSDEDCPKECLSNCEEMEYEKCEDNFVSRYKKRRIGENKKNPQRMKEMRLYALLQGDKITDQNRLAKELAPNKGPDPFKNLIYTPLGGQPGHKAKRGYK